MALAAETIGRMIDSAGFDASTAVVVGVRSSKETTVVSRGGAEDGGELGDTVGYAGSLAKQVTAACAALLLRDGALDLDASIAGLLPDLPAWAAEVRIRHLIHHTAGLPTTEVVWGQMVRDGERDWTSDGALAALSTLSALDRPPGSAFAYSNVGYVCLARILERVVGEPLAGVARRRLFDPLGMSSTSFWSGPAPSPPAARLAPPPGRPAPLSVGDGGMWTTVRDLLRWNDALLEDRLGITTTLHSPGTLDDGTPLDYAWGVRVSHESGARTESHGGSWEASTAKLVRLPDLGGGFAALATGGGVARMTALSSSLQHALLEPRGGWS
jgi:CubicO group peptidase (beta-lactamase class C family)